MIKKILCMLVVSTALLGSERTLSIIKPDAVTANQIGGIDGHLEKNGLKIVAMKMKKLTVAEAEQFYGEHKGKPFFADLVAYMTSGPVVVQVLEGDHAISRYRELMGSTDPQKAQAGTIRALYGKSVRQNAVHGSDSASSATREIAFFFTESEIVR